MLLKRGKKGISPLIATVLMIAFAVAIGTMLMNLGKDAIASVGDCPDVKLDIQTINGKPLFCYDTLNNKINVMIKNSGNVDIEKLQLRVTSPDFSSDDVDIAQSSLKTGAILTKNIGYTKSGAFKVEFIPIIVFSGKEKSCLDQAVVTESITKCN
jgi:flagellin-like protein